MQQLLRSTLSSFKIYDKNFSDDGGHYLQKTVCECVRVCVCAWLHACVHAYGVCACVWCVCVSRACVRMACVCACVRMSCVCAYGVRAYVVSECACGLRAYGVRACVRRACVYGVCAYGIRACVWRACVHITCVCACVRAYGMNACVRVSVCACVACVVSRCRWT